MSSFGTRVLQDISHSFPQKSVQLSKSRLHTTASKRRFWSFFEFSRKAAARQNAEKMPLSKNTIPSSLVAPKEVRNASEPLVKQRSKMSSSVSLSAKSACFSFQSKLPQKSFSKLTKSYMEHGTILSLLDENALPKNSTKLKNYKSLSKENAGDFFPVPGAINSSGRDAIQQQNEIGNLTPKHQETAGAKNINKTPKEMVIETKSELRDPPRKILTRSETVTKFDTKISEEESVENREKFGSSQLNDKIKTQLSDKHKYRDQLTLVKSEPTTTDPTKTGFQHPSRLPVRTSKLRPSILNQYKTENVFSSVRKVVELKHKLQLEESNSLPQETSKSTKSIEKNKVSVLASPARKQLHGSFKHNPQKLGEYLNRGKAGSQNGAGNSGQPMSGSSDDGGRRKPPYSHIPVASSKSYSVMKGNAESKKSSMNISNTANYSSKGNNDDCEEKEKPSQCKKKPKKQDCKRFCCPELKPRRCPESRQCSPSEKPTPPVKWGRDCRPKRGVDSCHPPPTKECNRETPRQNNEDYRNYQTCCKDDCDRDRTKNYQVCCPEKKKCQPKKPSSCSTEKKEEKPREICTKPRNDCRPTECPKPKSNCGNKRHYSQLATAGELISGGTRISSSFSVSSSLSTHGRIVNKNLASRSYTSDHTKSGNKDGCVPTYCTKKKKKKPPAKCLPLDQVGVAKPQKTKRSSSCSTPKSTTDVCSSKKEDPCKGVKNDKTKQESGKQRSQRELKEMSECKSIKQKKDSEVKAAPKSSLERVISPCKQRQLKREAEGKKGSSICSTKNFMHSSTLFTLPYSYLSNVETVFTTSTDKSLNFLPERNFTTLAIQEPRTDLPKRISEIKSLDDDDELTEEELYELIPLEWEEEE